MNPNPPPKEKRDQARDAARRDRVVALLQQAVDEQLFGAPDANGHRIAVTSDHAEAVYALLTGHPAQHSGDLDYSEREELERLRQHTHQNNG